VIRHSNLIAQRENTSQMDLFDESSEVTIPDPGLPNCPMWSKLEMLRQEKEVTGMYISGHPLDDFRIEIDATCNINIGDLHNMSALKNKDVAFAGIVTSAVHKMGKNGKPFGSFVVEDYYDSIQLFLFAEEYLKMKHFLENQTFVYVKARVQERYNSSHLEVRVKSMSLLSELAEKSLSDLILYLPVNEIDPRMVTRLVDVARKHKGKSKLKIALFDRVESTTVEMLSRKLRVEPIGFLKELLKEYEFTYRLN
jgi:DNA polymerase-3 subunit alpha